MTDFGLKCIARAIRYLGYCIVVAATFNAKGIRQADAQAAVDIITKLRDQE